jgi:hypothetical protein
MVAHCTELNRQTLLNFALKVVGGPLIYVCSRRVRDTTAATIAANIAAVRGLVVTSLGVIPVGCVTDNASAMVAALSGCELEATDDEEGEDEKEETDEAPPALFLEEENPPNEDEELVFDNFFVHIRCAAHVFQLIIGDVAKSMPSVSGVLRRLSSMERGAKASLRQLRRDRGHTRENIPRPAATRWNSATRAAGALLDFAFELAMVGFQLSADDVLCLKVFCVLTAPLCWATCAIQADAAGLAHVTRECNAIEASFETIKNQAQSFHEITRNALFQGLAVAQASFNTRRRQYLSNVPLKAVALLEGSEIPSFEEQQNLARLGGAYFATVRRSEFAERLRDEVSQFAFRTDSDRLNQQYWETTGKQLIALWRFREDMRALLATEAACERSFAVEGAVWRQQRNRMSETAVDNETFVKFNYQRIRGIRTAAVRIHIDEIPRDTWNRMIDSLKDGKPTTPKIRRGATKPLVDNITTGKAVEVEYKVGNRDAWFAGVVVQRTAAHKWKVAWIGESNEVSVVDFGDAETVWRFTTTPLEV